MTMNTTDFALQSLYQQEREQAAQQIRLAQTTQPQANAAQSLRYSVGKTLVELGQQLLADAPTAEYHLHSRAN